MEGSEMNVNVKKLVETCVEIMGTKRALADYLGVDQRSVYRWIARQVRPSGLLMLRMYDLSIKEADKIRQI
jgi:hypothetical protein